LGGNRIIQVQEPKGTPWIETVQYEDGTCVELFYPRPDQYPLGTQLGKNHLCFSVENIRELEERLDECGITVTSRPKIVRDGNWQLWCQDPNGYPIEFMQYMPGCPQLGCDKCVVLS
jgi:catechol 2,3-dioxygenase-like lactoylglutathione lyase family enzyme